MDPQTLEALQDRVATLERRLLLAVSGLFFVSVYLLVSVLVQNAYAQSNLVRAAGDKVTRADLNAIQQSVNEFRSELAAIGVRVTAIEIDMDFLKNDVKRVFHFVIGTLLFVLGTLVTLMLDILTVRRSKTIRMERIMWYKVSWPSKTSCFLVSGAWLLHLLAWLLPVHKELVALPEGLPGWQAFLSALSGVSLLGGTHFVNWYRVLATASAVTTLLFIFGSPWVVLRGSPSIWRASAWTAVTAFVINAQWYVFSAGRSDLRIGYFLWWFSFILLAIGLFDLARHHRGGRT